MSQIPEEMLVWYGCCMVHLVMPAAAIGRCGHCGRVPKPLKEVDDE